MSFPRHHLEINLKSKLTSTEVNGETPQPPPVHSAHPASLLTLRYGGGKQFCLLTQGIHTKPTDTSGSMHFVPWHLP